MPECLIPNRLRWDWRPVPARSSVAFGKPVSTKTNGWNASFLDKFVEFVKLCRLFGMDVCNLRCEDAKSRRFVFAQFHQMSDSLFHDVVSNWKCRQTMCK